MKRAKCRHQCIFIRIFAALVEAGGRLERIELGVAENGRMTVKRQRCKGVKLLVVGETAMGAEGAPSAGKSLEKQFAVAELDPLIDAESRRDWVAGICHDYLPFKRNGSQTNDGKLTARATLPTAVRAAVWLGFAVLAGCSRDAAADFGKTPGAAEMAHVSPENFSRTTGHHYEERRCADDAGILITAGAIGPARIGSRISTIRKNCVTRAADRGTGARIVISPAGGEVTLTVSGRDSVVTRAETSDPAFRTEDGLGIGTPVQALHSRYGAGCAGPDSSFTFPALPRISFRGARAVTQIVAGDSSGCG